MSQTEKSARQVVRQANGLSPGFRYYDNPYEGETMVCPLCEKTIAAGLENCPECGAPIPGQQRSREKVNKNPLVMLMALLLLVLVCLGMYFFIREMVESGFITLLIGQ